MLISKFNYKLEFINILIYNLTNLGLSNIYKLDKNTKYNIAYISNIIVNISITCGKLINKYIFPHNLSQYLNNYITNRSYSIENIYKLVKTQISNNDELFINTYIIIGHDIPIIINELTVIC